MSDFRFQELDIWKKAIELGMVMADWADELEAKKLFRYAEQLRGAALSVSNNISEGAGSDSKKEFAYFLNVARRSVFEDANMVVFFQMRRLIPDDEARSVLKELVVLAKMIQAFKRSLGN